ncbi:MAG: HD domain-containing protein, partial [Actinobacteria bacterium]|nr:HD domain-containing protein [Actinomycetota bacterium]
MEFRDVLYGTVSVPEYLVPAIRTPEFVRLRGVGLSNVDSYEFKDLSPSRWAHGIAVAALAWKCARLRGLSTRDEVHLVLAGLLHDVATPPFAHTAEYVVPNFDHEVESRNILAGRWSDYVDPSTAVFN